jgi:hypothetical protein
VKAEIYDLSGVLLDSFERSAHTSRSSSGSCKSSNCISNASNLRRCVGRRASCKAAAVDALGHSVEEGRMAISDVLSEAVADLRYYLAPDDADGPCRYGKPGETGYDCLMQLARLMDEVRELQTALARQYSEIALCQRQSEAQSIRHQRL